MDTKDLQHLFNRPSGTRLSAAAVLSHVEGRRRARRRAGAAGLAVLVAAAVAAGAVHLRAGSTSPGPDVLATPAPATPTEGRAFQESVRPTVVGTTVPEATVPAGRCDLSVPGSWHRAIEAAWRTGPDEQLIPVRGGGHVRATVDSVSWERPGADPVMIHDGPEQVWDLHSDSRFVVFQVDDGLWAWDVEQPEQGAWLVSGEMEVQENWRALSSGQLWFEEPVDFRGGGTGRALFHADLSRGESLGWVRQDQDHWAREPVAGRLQLVAEGRPTLLLDPDGTTAPFEGPGEAPEILGRSGEIHLISPWRGGADDEKAEAQLWNPQWDETFPVPGATGLAGDWVVVDGTTLFNHRTGVNVHFDQGVVLEVRGEGEDAYLRIIHDVGTGSVNDQYSHVLRLVDLPEVRC